MKTAFVYTDAYLDYDYGPAHPLKIIRLKLTFELIHAYGLLALPLFKPSSQEERKRMIWPFSTAENI